MFAPWKATGQGDSVNVVQMVRQVAVQMVRQVAVEMLVRRAAVVLGRRVVSRVARRGPRRVMVLEAPMTPRATQWPRQRGGHMSRQRRV